MARTGVGSLTLIDPEDFAEENVGRHILTGDSVGKSKVEELSRHVARINPDCRVTALKERFDASLLSSRPDLIISTADSFQAASLVNSYALRENIPAVFGGVWGEASVAEILYVLPGKTPCYDCLEELLRENLADNQGPDPSKFNPGEKMFEAGMGSVPAYE